MSFNELLNKYCPNGVSFKTLRDISQMQRGTSLTKKQANEGTVPVISGGKEPAFYCDTENREGETITVAGSGAGAGYVQYWNKPIFVGDAFSIKGKHDVSTKYLYYCLTNMQEAIYSTKKGGGVPHVHISDIDNFEIPVPPVDVQSKIVEILDCFSSLEAELEAELEGRKKQYYYYRNFLINKYVYTKTKLSNVVKIQRGKRLVRKDLQNEGKYPVYQNSLVPLGYNEYHNCDGGKTLVIAAGAAGDILYSKTPFWAADDCYYFIPIKQIDERYLYYALKDGQQILKTMLHKGGVPRLSQPPR